jgi:hypothetical protein
MLLELPLDKTNELARCHRIQFDPAFEQELDLVAGGTVLFEIGYCVSEPKSHEWRQMPKKRRKPGPPARYGYRPTLTIRLQDHVYAAVKKAAAKTGKSLSETIEDTLEASLVELARQLEDARRLAREASAARTAARIQAIREAGFRLLREAEGKISVIVPVEMLHAEADLIQDEEIKAEIAESRQTAAAAMTPKKKDDAA